MCCQPQSLQESDSALLRPPHPMKHPPLLLPLTAVPLRPGTDVLFGVQVPKKKMENALFMEKSMSS